MITIREFKDQYMSGRDRFDGNLVSQKYGEYFRDNAQVGDGATVCYFSDAHAYTIIKRTAKTLTLQRDKATLKQSFKPEFIVGGFCAHCTNQSEQDYDYERDPNGGIEIARWSERKKGFYVNGCLHVIPNRREFYDYNF